MTFVGSGPPLGISAPPIANGVCLPPLPLHDLSVRIPSSHPRTRMVGSRPSPAASVSQAMPHGCKPALCDLSKSLRWATSVPTPTDRAAGPDPERLMVRSFSRESANALVTIRMRARCGNRLVPLRRRQAPLARSRVTSRCFPPRGGHESRFQRPGDSGFAASCRANLCRHAFLLKARRRAPARSCRTAPAAMLRKPACVRGLARRPRPGRRQATLKARSKSNGACAVGAAAGGAGWGAGRAGGSACSAGRAPCVLGSRIM